MAGNEKPPRVRLNIFLSEPWHDRLLKIGERDDKSINEIIREAVRDYLRKEAQSKAVGPIQDYLGPKDDDAEPEESEAV